MRYTKWFPVGELNLSAYICITCLQLKSSPWLSIWILLFPHLYFFIIMTIYFFSKENLFVLIS